MMDNRSDRPRDGVDSVLVIGGSVGAGHDGVAAEMASQLANRGTIVDRRDYLDALPLPLRILLRKGYGLLNEHAPGALGALYFSIERTSWMPRVVDRFCRLAHPELTRWSYGHTVVISTYPLASQSLGQLKVEGSVTSTLITYLTDPAVHRLWIHPAVDHHVTVSELTSEMGWTKYRTAMQPVGPLVDPAFMQPVSHEKRLRIRSNLDLSPEGMVILVTGGSLGLGKVKRTVKTIRASVSAEVIVLCGRNGRLRGDLSRIDGVLALGWRSDVADLMAAADVLVHNAGGLSLTEAMVSNLPAVTYLPIPGHGKANAEALEDAGVIPWPRSNGELVRCLQRLRGGRDARVEHPGVDTIDILCAIFSREGD